MDGSGRLFQMILICTPARSIDMTSDVQSIPAEHIALLTVAVDSANLSISKRRIHSELMGRGVP